MLKQRETEGEQEKNYEQKKNDTIIPMVIAIAEKTAKIMLLSGAAFGSQPLFFQTDRYLITLSALWDNLPHVQS